MASPNAGGFVELTINGTPYSIAGELEIEETNFEAECVVNQDGTVARIQKPKPFRFELKIRDRQQAQAIVGEIFRDDVLLDVSAIERQMRRTVLLTGAFATGTPKRNTQNGEISGIKLESAQMRFLT